MGTQTLGIATMFTSDVVSTDREKLKSLSRALGVGTDKFNSGVWNDFKTTARHRDAPDALVLVGRR